MNIKIYQINTDRDDPVKRRTFQSLEALEKIFKSTEIKSDLYDKVFDGDVDCHSLNDIFRKFNLDHPEGYRGRSLSVSDVVEIVEAPEGIKKGCFFVDDIGFKKVSFDSEKTQDVTAEDKIAVLYIAPGEPPKVMYIKPELEEMQRLVGGYIEEYMPFDDEVAIICNEEGKLNGMPLNRAIYDESDGKRGEMIDIIAGQFFLANAPYESEKFQSLTPEMIDKYNKRFRYPESFMKLGGQIMVIPEKPPARGHER